MSFIIGKMLKNAIDLQMGELEIRKQGTDLIDLRRLLEGVIFGMDLFDSLRGLKQPRRSDLTSDLKSVTSITYRSMCILFTWCGPF